MARDRIRPFQAPIRVAGFAFMLLAVVGFAGGASVGWYSTDTSGGTPDQADRSAPVHQAGLTLPPTAASPVSTSRPAGQVATSTAPVSSEVPAPRESTGSFIRGSNPPAAAGQPGARGLSAPVPQNAPAPYRPAPAPAPAPAVAPLPVPPPAIDIPLMPLNPISPIQPKQVTIG